MNYGLYLSASGVLTQMYRQDVFANNLANVKTAGFRGDLATVRQRDPESVEDNLGFESRNDLLDRLGGGVMAGPQHISLTPGSIEHTGNDLDAALTDVNAFFTVAVTDPKTGQTQVRLTRDGRFSRGAGDKLVSASDGAAVLGPNDQPITLDPNYPVAIGADGRIVQNNQEIARLQVVSARDPHQLIKDGHNRFRLAGGDVQRQTIAAPHIEPGAIEASSVDPVRSMVDMIAVTRAINSNADLIRYHDQIMDKAINTLGRIA